MKILLQRVLIAPMIFFILMKLSLAGGIETSPTHLRISSEGPVAVLRVANTNTKPMTFQVQTYKWTQDGQTPTNKLIVTPPIFTVAPNKTQIIRFGFYKLKESNLQQTFRVSLKELPYKEGSSKKNKFSVKVLLDISIPLTVAPKGNIIKTLTAELFKKEDKLYFKVNNTGNVYVYFNKVTFEANGKTLSLDTHDNHVLAHQSREWVIPSKNLPKAKEFKVVMDNSFGDFQGNFKLGVVKDFTSK